MQYGCSWGPVGYSWDLEALGIFSFYFTFPSLNDVVEIILAPSVKEKALFPFLALAIELHWKQSFPRLGRQQGPEDKVHSALSVLCPWKYLPANEDNRCVSVGEQVGTFAKSD